MLLLEGLDLARRHHAAHRAEVRGALDQRRRRSRRACALDLDVDVRVQALEFLGPQRHQVVQRVGTDAGEVAGHAGGGLVGRQRRVDLDGLGMHALRRKGHAGQAEGSNEFLDDHVRQLLRGRDHPMTGCPAC
jgi:hypothetical protein